MGNESLKEIAQIIESNQGVGRGRPLPDDSDNRGSSADDLDSAYWEDYLGGPDDSDIETYYETLSLDYEEEYCDGPLTSEEEQEEQRVSDEEEHEPIFRTEEIVQWLSHSRLAIKFKNREGFFVPKGPHVRLKDGTTIDLFEWLFEEGITGGSSAAGYSIVYSDPESEYGEKLSFFKIVVDAPFSRLASEGADQDLDDDIPF